MGWKKLQKILVREERAELIAKQNVRGAFWGKEAWATSRVCSGTSGIGSGFKDIAENRKNGRATRRPSNIPFFCLF